MRWWLPWLVLLVSACALDRGGIPLRAPGTDAGLRPRSDGGGTARDGGRPFDAGGIEDAGAVDAGQASEWVVVDSLSVPCRGEGVQSRVVLEHGRVWRLRATGTCQVANRPRVDSDADWVLLETPLDVVEFAPPLDVGIGVDDPTVDHITSPDWGAYRDTHEYEIDYPATGAAIEVRFHDSNYDNNDGALTVELLEFR